MQEAVVRLEGLLASWIKQARVVERGAAGVREHDPACEPQYAPELVRGEPEP